MQTFLEWLQAEQRQDVPQEILDGYERGFRQALQQLLGKVKDPLLRDKFQRMLDCPIKDSQGRCHTFTDYVVGVLNRHQIQRIADIEDALGYVFQCLMLDKKTNGEPKSTVFAGFDFNRPLGSGNPLEARFKTAVSNAVRNISSGRIRRLLTTDRHSTKSVSAEEIPSRTNHDQEYGELIRDIGGLLARKEKDVRMPLGALFHAIVNGESTAEQRRLFGVKAASVGREVILQTIKDYAHQTGNVALTQLIAKIERPSAVPSSSPQRSAEVSPRDKNYASILAVVDRLGRPVGSADLGRLRRRWLEYPPREIAGGHRNRLEEILAQMLRDGVLRVVTTSRGAIAYLPGEHAEAYRRAATMAG